MFNSTIKYLFRLYIFAALAFFIAPNLGGKIPLFDNYWNAVIIIFLSAIIILVIIPKPYEAQVWSNRKTIGIMLFVIINAFALAHCNNDIVIAIQEWMMYQNLNK